MATLNVKDKLYNQRKPLEVESITGDEPLLVESPVEVGSNLEVDGDLKVNGEIIGGGGGSPQPYDITNDLNVDLSEAEVKAIMKKILDAPYVTRKLVDEEEGSVTTIVYTIKSVYVGFIAESNMPVEVFEGNIMVASPQIFPFNDEENPGKVMASYQIVLKYADDSEELYNLIAQPI